MNAVAAGPWGQLVRNPPPTEANTPSMLPPIEKGIPLPDATSQLVGHLLKMEVGDSIFLKDKTTSGLASLLRKANAKSDAMFVSRSIDGGARIWRIE
jgi:hypothetical protein